MAGAVHMSIRSAPHNLRRNLFGADHDELTRELQAEAAALHSAQGARWNFCFNTETPLPGAYVWEKNESECEDCDGCCSVEEMTVAPPPSPAESPVGCSLLAEMSKRQASDRLFGQHQATKKRATGEQSPVSIMTTV
eukprot:comp22861_c0_seq1/m.36072 comp22861_c0_seq1/g.36072  ORF comp22861_c0_seq1/g.36072 comp22861_c0_seq1/m.36072 type:complete len:137 (-) comp22861_c0_seq1:792-1202(-)